MKFPQLFSFLLTSGWVLLSNDMARACAVCFGDPSSPQGKGLGLAVLFLMGVTGTVLGGVVVTVAVWTRRARK